MLKTQHTTFFFGDIIEYMHLLQFFFFLYFQTLFFMFIYLILGFTITYQDVGFVVATYYNGYPYLYISFTPSPVPFRQY